MKVFSFPALLLLCFLFTTPLLAQDTLPLRVGVRDGYARLVFDWDNKVKYSIDETNADKVIVRFETSAKINSSPSNVTVSPNITSITMLSSDPLSVEVGLQKGSAFRNFNIGKRVILDVYDSTLPKEQQVSAKPAPQPKTKPNQKKSGKVTADAVPKKLAEITAKRETEKTPTASPPAYVLVPETLQVKNPKVPKKKEEKKKQHLEAEKKAQKAHRALKKAAEQIEHVISLRSTKSMNVAMFQNLGVLHIIIDGDVPNIKPDLSSPEPHIFPDFHEQNIDGAKAYSLVLPEGNDFSMKGLDGGLIWALVMGDKVKTNTPVKLDKKMGAGQVIIPLKTIGHILDYKDPLTGDLLKIVSVEEANQFAGEEKSFVEFDILTSHIGLVIRPKVDDLKVEKSKYGIEISRPKGLDLSSEKDLQAARIFGEQVKTKVSQEKNAKKDRKKIFKFNEWKIGTGDSDLIQQETILLSALHQNSNARQVEDLVTLGKMFLSHGRGAEALGYFDFALSKLPGLEHSGEFRALRGVAKALDWKNESALQDFLRSDIKNEDEVKYWQAYVLADLGDWQQAVSLLPEDFEAIYDYPHNITNRLAPVLAEISLRDGKVERAEELITLLEHNTEHMLEPIHAYLQYLRGEAARQKGEIENADHIWDELSVGKDDLYRTKAGLALTILRANEGKITNDEAIDNMERLRYAWRGDELEAQVNYWLGNAYFKDKDYLKGLFIMREAAAIAGDTVLAGRIASEMSDAFTNLFLKDGLVGVTPLDAISLYDQFSELTPLGAEGDKLVQILAEHLVKADLLDRAAKLLSHQVDHRLKGEDRLKIAIRLAAIELINKKPQSAVNALAKASRILQRLSNEEKKKAYQREMTLLKTKAYLQNKQYKSALTLVETLSPDQTSNRLRADVAWQAGFWEEAADAMEFVLNDEDLTSEEGLSEGQVSLIMNRAIALNLINDRIALSNMRAKFIAVMKETDKAYQFEVITRTRKAGILADRETLLSIMSEVDLFGEFLESYRLDKP